MAEAPLRLFVAVPVPPAALEACRAVVDAVRNGPAGRGPRWVRTENLHVTLRFLGDTPPDRLGAVTTVLEAVVAGRPPFTVALAGAGAFPNRARPRALWLGIVAGADELAAFAHALDGALEPLGWPAESRSFRPHLTVARTDAPPIAAAVAAADALEAAARRWRTSFLADHLVLYRSHLGAGPPRYEPVTTVALDG